MNQPLLTVKEVSSMLHMHYNTIYELADKGKINHIRIGRNYRFTQNNIEEFINKNSIKFVNFPYVFPKNEQISLSEYDKVYLKGDNVVALKKQRWRYRIGTVYLRKYPGGSESWGIEYRDQNGKRKQEIVPNAHSKREALIALNHSVQKVFNQQNDVVLPKKINFCELAEFYIQDYAMVAKDSWETDVYRLKNIKLFFKDIELHEITPGLIQKFRSSRLGDGISRSTSNREITLLKKMFNVAIEEGYLETNPARKIKMFSEMDSVKDRILTEEEEPRLLAALAEYLKPVVLIALHTGMRKGEILKLRWKNVDFLNRIIKVERTKSKKTRFIPINTFLFRLLTEMKLHKEKHQLVYPFRTIQKAFGSARKRAGLEDFTFHDLRRTFGTRLLEGGVDIVTISKLYGHSSVLVTQRYLHPKDQLSKEAVELLVGISSEKVKKEQNLLLMCDLKKDPQQKESVIH